MKKNFELVNSVSLFKVKSQIKTLCKKLDYGASEESASGKTLRLQVFFTAKTLKDECPP